LVEVRSGRRYPSPDLAVSPEAPRTPRPRWPLYAAAAGALAVIVVLVVIFVVKPGGNAANEPSAQTPKFDFQILSATPIPGSEHTSGDPAGAAKKAGDDIRLVLDRMYSLAFLDPNDWQSGDYASVFGFFDRGAAARRAQADASTLTLGSNAGTRFADVQPAGGTLSVRVLLDGSGTPVSAAAAVQFKAKATGKGGPSELVTSKGHYFMHILEGGWTIFAYSISRNDTPIAAAPSTSGSAS
jgi:hypothetical protein